MNLWFEIGIAHLSVRCLLSGFGSLLKKIQTLEKSEYKNKPAKIFHKVLQICRDDYGDYFEQKTNDEFQEYARVLGLVPNLFQSDSFPEKNMPYAIVSNLIGMIKALKFLTKIYISYKISIQFIY